MEIRWISDRIIWKSYGNQMGIVWKSDGIIWNMEILYKSFRILRNCCGIVRKSNGNPKEILLKSCGILRKYYGPPKEILGHRMESKSYESLWKEIRWNHMKSTESYGNPVDILRKSYGNPVESFGNPMES